MAQAPHLRRPRLLLIDGLALPLGAPVILSQLGGTRRGSSVLKFSIPAIGLFLLASIAAAGLVATALRSGSGDDSIPTVSVAPLWSTAAATDVNALTEAYPVVFVGTVQALSGQRDEPIAPGSGSGATLPISLFDVLVDERINGDVADGANVTIQQAGGLITRSDGTQARVVIENDTPILVGETYLFFATWAPSGSGALVTAPYSRFPLDDGSVRAPSAWQNLGAVQAIAGAQLSGVRATVADALEDAR